MASQPDPLMTSLVRFDPPQPVSQMRKAKHLNPAKVNLGGKGGLGSAAGAESGAPLLEDILAAIMPPKEVAAPQTIASSAGSATAGAASSGAAGPSGGEPWVECVSAQPATRLEVIHLQEVLDNRLVHRQAREIGVCGVRSELYASVFDELIRQITINCPERGLLLLRVRDELRQSIAAHKALYETGIAFGVRKSAIAEKGLPEMRQRVKQLEREKAELEARVQELLLQIDGFEKKSQDERLQDDKKHNDEVSFFRKTNQQLSTHLKTETEKANSKK